MSPRQPVRTGAAGLSAREREILDAYALDWSVKLAARRVGISPRTFQMHAIHACRKLGAVSVSQAVFILYRAERTQ